MEGEVEEEGEKEEGKEEGEEERMEVDGMYRCKSGELVIGDAREAK